MLAVHLPRFEQWSQEPGTPHPVTVRVGDQVVCYVLCDFELHQLREQVIRNWMSLVDPFSLPSLSFAVEPKQRGTPLLGPVTIKIKICYVSWNRASKVAPAVPEELKKILNPN